MTIRCQMGEPGLVYHRFAVLHCHRLIALYPCRLLTRFKNTKATMNCSTPNQRTLAPSKNSASTEPGNVTPSKGDQPHLVFSCGLSIVSGRCMLRTVIEAV